MDNSVSVSVRVAGAEIHGFHTLEDLDVAKMMEEAKTRWLRPNEIHALLYNHSLFPIHVKPVHLPRSGTIVLFDRKKLRNFRKDGHNWKKKKDGKTVKEAHEHLKVGNEERIHVYYAHGEDSPSFVRRCYWLLDKTYEHVVLVHYRETSELQDLPVTPPNSSSASSYSDSSSRLVSEETDSGADRAYYLGPETPFVGESTEHGERITVQNHDIRLHEINTLEWEDLLVSNDPNNFNITSQDNIPFLQQQNHSEMYDSQNNSLQPIAESGSVDVGLRESGYLLNKGTNSGVQNQEFDMVTEHEDDSAHVVKDGFGTQDSFGRWIDGIMTVSPGSFNNLPVESTISSGHESNTSTVIDHYQFSTQQQIFSITDISPAWSFAAEETKVIVVGYFHPAHSHFAETNLFCVFGDACVPAEMVQVGVFRCRVLPHNPGIVNFYLSLDGHTPISEVMSFEYRASILENGLSSHEDNKWEEFQVQIRLSRLLFSTTNSLNMLLSNISPNARKEAKKFVSATSFIDKDWAYLIKSIGKNEISFPQAKINLFEIILKNKLQEWLLCRVVEGCQITTRDRQGQGVLHLCAILGYAWVVRPYSHSGLSLDFRDARGWTALHWAAFYGREKMVAILLSAGANPSLVSDPTSEFPGGCFAADLASKNGYDGLAAYLAEKGLTEHFRLMSLSGNISGSLQSNTTDLVNPGNLSEEQLCQKDTLTAYRTAAEAASRIQSAFRENSFKQRKKAVQIATPETEARDIIAAMKIQHAFRNYDTRKKIAAAGRIQYRFRTWKIRKDFLNMRRQAIKIQAAFRALKVRRHYHKILWSVGVLEKGILRWRQKRKGFRGLQVESTEVVDGEQKKVGDDEEDFFRISRMQAEERIERSVVRVQALFRSFRAQQEYRRMKMAYDQVKLEELLDSDVGFD
ncbi:Calmodulin-binding transcription activator [Thalictrum thalictroides]|uniref:Calmodulin-binding transcription activator n=1 Tax=Thalictrum thalictroides TaxID=46969 RepID=A0A7J6UU90_THATH|nr:Calmodulin-binding transcription activator [Thalictrum thalictroides]